MAVWEITILSVKS